jgi:hypothetical protein
MSDEYANDVVRKNAIERGTRYDMDPIPQGDKLVLRACHAALMEVDTWLTVFKKRREVIQRDITELTAQAINEHCDGDIEQDEIAVALFDWENDVLDIITNDNASEIINKMKENRNGQA